MISIPIWLLVLLIVIALPVVVGAILVIIALISTMIYPDDDGSRYWD